MISFDDLETKYGAPIAYHLLQEMERAARIASWSVSDIDPETRLKNAQLAQDTVYADATILYAA